MKFCARASALAALLTVLGARLAPARESAPRDPLSALWSRVEARRAGVATIVAEFTQEKHLALFAAPERSFGTVRYKAPDRLLWDYGDDGAKVWIVGPTMTAYYPGLKRAERIGVGSVRARLLRAISSPEAVATLAQYFVMTLTDRADWPAYVLELQPKTRHVARKITAMRVEIDRQLLLPVRVWYRERDGDETSYEFRNLRVNVDVPDALFAVRFPADVTVTEAVPLSGH